MTIRETTIAKLQQLPESLLQQVSDFIDLLADRQAESTAIGNPDDQLSEAWMQWFERMSEKCTKLSASTSNEYWQHR